MKRKTGWILVTILVLFASFLLIPTSHANRSESNPARTDLVKDEASRNQSTALERMAGLSSLALPRPQSPAPEPVTPISAQAVGFAVTDAARDLPSVAAAGGENARGDSEVNEQNGSGMKHPTAEGANLPSKDGALQGARTIQSQAPSAPSLVFQGINDADNDLLIGGRVAPSDQNAAIGPNDIVQTVNDGFKVWDKNGNPRTGFAQPKLISALFSKLGTFCSNNDQGDPVVLYDRLANRWFITQFAFVTNRTPPFHQCVAVSQNADPTGAYFAYDFVTPGTNFPDYGKFGTWPDGYYMTVNQFDAAKPANNSFNGVGIYALDRKKMLVGDPTASFIYFNESLAARPEGFNPTLPSDMDGLTAPPPGAPNVIAYLISATFENPPFNKDALRLFNFHADFANPANSTFTERAESPVLVAPFDPRAPSVVTGGRTDVKEPPPATPSDYLDSIAYHLMYRLQYRNRGGIETLVSSTTVNVSGVNPVNAAAYQAGVRYFELQKTGPNAPYLLYDNATFSPDAGNPATGVNRWLPSAAIDNQGNLAVGYSTSSTTVFPSITYAGRDFNALGGLTGETTMFAGTGSQLTSGNRWGDYSSMAVDPSDDCTFLYTNQYYDSNSSFNWKTKLGKFKFPNCQAPAQGTLSGTITACDSGAPIAGAVVQLSNGFSATTGPDGKYSIQQAPGTYTVTVTNGARNCVASAVSTIAVTDGSTTTFNACLNGTANLVYENTPNTVVVSGGNGNGFVDPNECDGLTVTLVNRGCATAKGITAKLSSSTPGVTVSQPNSTFPDAAIDAATTNTIPFSITTSPGFVCGTTINFTLTLTYAGGSNTTTFTVNTCGPTPPGPTQTFTGSIDPTDPKTTAGRLGRNGVQSTCASGQKACPGALGAGSRTYEALTFNNPGGATACVTITLTSPRGDLLIGAAYANSFDPTDPTFCNNYLGDPGGSATNASPTAPVSWSVNLPPNQNLVVVVMEVNAGTPSTAYTISVSGIQTPPLAGNGPCPACVITPPADITVNSDPSTCGAIVTFPNPTSTGTCGALTLSQASGTRFPVGTTTVTVTATSGATATFKVTVKDTTPPTLTCPANIVATTPPNATSVVVNYPAPVVSDNCPGATVTYSIPSGSAFSVGTTTVTAFATDASGNVSPTCAFSVTVNQPQSIQFTSPTYAVDESGVAAQLTVTRSGGSVGPASVDYATSDGTATQKSDYIIEIGTLQFADGETTKTLLIPVVNDAYVDGNKTFTVTLSNPTGSGVSLGATTTTTVTITSSKQGTPTTNPLEDPQFFVRQQYLDFLNRQPETAGLNYWTGPITQCGSDANCIKRQRIAVSAAFFFSQEFQDTGFFVYRLYQTLKRQPTYLEFVRDRSNLMAGSNIDAQKSAFAVTFSNRTEFVGLYPTSQTPAQYVDALNANTGSNLTQAQRDALVAGLSGATPAETRGSVLRKVIDNAAFIKQQTNSAFVLQQYFGYLRRDADLAGFNFWLNVLNTSNGNFNGMVCAFLTSAEYQQRFSPVVPRTNSECSNVGP